MTLDLDLRKTDNLKDYFSPSKYWLGLHIFIGYLSVRIIKSIGILENYYTKYNKSPANTEQQ